MENIITLTDALDYASYLESVTAIVWSVKLPQFDDITILVINIPDDIKNAR